MISLNGVTLSEDLLWENEFDTPAISENIQRTLLGVQIVQHMPLVGGRIIKLAAIANGFVYDCSNGFLRSNFGGFDHWRVLLKFSWLLGCTH